MLQITVCDVLAAFFVFPEKHSERKYIEMKKYEGKRFEIISRELAVWDMMDIFEDSESLINRMKEYPDVFEEIDESLDWDELVDALANDDIAFLISDWSSYSIEDIYVVDECDFERELENLLEEYRED